ncbi:nitroreductase family protein [Chitinophaga tropicalis]|uniref:nitroreductase family protein n=1 Tax=Chitinophaga tropicalis TaxID=2683588 RepID=UPI0018E052C1|nr:nitroreductase family protein [Chitinophaga tropicalis]
MANTRGLPTEALTGFRDILIAHITGRTQEENLIWTVKQAYIGLGTGIATASELKIDTTPMEGFNPPKFDEILGLKENGLRSMVLLALGYRDEAKDPYVNAAKVRLPLEVFTELV